MIHSLVRGGGLEGVGWVPNLGNIKVKNDLMSSLANKINKLFLETVRCL